MKTNNMNNKPIIKKLSKKDSMEIELDKFLNKLLRQTKKFQDNFETSNYEYIDNNDSNIISGVLS